MIVHFPDLSLPYVKKRYNNTYSVDLSRKPLDTWTEVSGLSPEDINFLSVNTGKFIRIYDNPEDQAKKLILFNYKELTETASSGLESVILNAYNNLGSENPVQPQIMGIVNVTPDSFSDGGSFFSTEEAMARIDRLVKDGADIIDIGGESTRPDAAPVSADEEMDRVIPVIKETYSRYPDKKISVDTTKPEVAKEALKAGAGIINDISGMTFENGELADIAAEYGAALVIMHIKGTPKTMQQDPFYKDVVSEVLTFLHDQGEYAKSRGVKNIIIDPGFGFGKRLQDNYELLQRLNEFKSLGYPVLAGISRKTFLGKPYGLEPRERDINTKIAELTCVKKGAEIIRTHDVKSLKNALNLLEYIENPEKLA